jgi:hypothetical protein
MTRIEHSREVTPEPEHRDATPASGGGPSDQEAAGGVSESDRKAATNFTWFLTKAGGLILSVGGVGLLFATPGIYWWACAAIAVYGVYVLLHAGTSRL